MDRASRRGAGPPRRCVGLCLRPPIANWADRPTVRAYRAGRLYRQRIEGWWIDAETLVMVCVHRLVQPLALEGIASSPPVSRGRSPLPTRGCGSWGGRSSNGRVNLASGSTGAVRYAGSAWATLPAAVRQQVGEPTGHGAIRRYPEGGIDEQVYAFRRTVGLVSALTAHRSTGASPDTAAALGAAPRTTCVTTTEITSALVPYELTPRQRRFGSQRRRRS